MAKRRVTKKAASRIAEERMSALAEMSKTAARNGMDERAVRYVFIARMISQKTRTPMPEASVSARNAIRRSSREGTAE